MKWPIGALPAKVLVPLALAVLGLVEFLGVLPQPLGGLLRDVLAGIQFDS